MIHRSSYLEHLASLRRAPAVVTRDPRHYFVDAGVMSLAHLGDFRVFAGVLVELWSEGELVRECACGGAVFIHTIAGSPLSGTHSWSGGCDACGRGVRGPRRGDTDLFADLHQPLFERLRERAVAFRPDRDGALPLPALAEIARGERGVCELRVESSGARYTFEWATGALRDARGRLLLRVVDRELHLAGRVPAWRWERATLCTSDGATCYRVREYERGAVPAHAMAAGAAELARIPSRTLETWIDDRSAAARYRVGRDGLYAREGTRALAWDVRAPLSVCALVTDDGEALAELTDCLLTEATHG